MKPYFAKFLPVDGEIKEGDMFLWKDEVHKFHSDAGYGMKTYTQYNEKDESSLIVNWSNCRGKVKLFLCSRDIQVGDKIRAEYGATMGDDREILREEGDCWIIIYGEDELYLAKNKSFKIIGEISPEAGWVKEGMEFGEDELGYLPCKGGTIYDFDTVKHKIEQGFDDFYIAIKGPCGHFH